MRGREHPVRDHVAVLGVHHRRADDGVGLRHVRARSSLLLVRSHVERSFVLQIVVVAVASFVFLFFSDRDSISSPRATPPPPPRTPTPNPYPKP